MSASVEVRLLTSGTEAHYLAVLAGPGLVDLVELATRGSRLLATHGPLNVRLLR